MMLATLIALLGATAWPLATLLVAWLFRRDVHDALGRVGRVKFRDVEVTFGADLRQAEGLARSLPPRERVVLESDESAPADPMSGAMLVAGARRSSTLAATLAGSATSGSPAEAGTTAIPVHDRREPLIRLAARSPREAIAGAWGVLGQALVRAAIALGDRRGTTADSPDGALKFLIARGWMTGDEADLAEQVRRLRDQGARTDLPTPTTDEATRFIDLAIRLAERVAALG